MSVNDEPEREVAIQRFAQRAVSYKVLFVVVMFTAAVAFVAGTRSDALYAQLAPILGIKIASDSLDLSDTQATYRYLLANYDGTLDKQALIDGASRGMVAATGDKHTVFMDREEADEFQKSLTGEISGIGAEIGVREDQPTILRVLSDSPAEKAGVAARDVILGVNEQSMHHATAETAAEKIRGEAGTSVKLLVRRGTEQKEFTITRAKVNDISVRPRVEGDVGIIVISRFDDKTGDLTTSAIRALKERGIKKIVIDLRDNGGGYLEAARDVASLWLNDVVVATERTDGKVVDEVRAGSNPLVTDEQTVVLINESSASASEILAGALKDHKKARIIGEQSYGKGTVQKVIDLPGGRKLKVTTAHWYTPNGQSVTDNGITPDSEVNLSNEDINAGRDPQMDAAIAELR